MPIADKKTNYKPYVSELLPDCAGMKAFVLPGAFFSSCVGLMAEAGFERANTVEEADVVVFIGGEDINPSLYKQEPMLCTYFSDDRDTVELSFYYKALKLRKPMFGICRGAQFLHAMNGGELWQDVNNHGGGNHQMVDHETGETIEVTSIHHQMLRDAPNLQVIATTPRQLATRFRAKELSIDIMNPNKEGMGSEMEIEAGAYLDSGCFFVQGHPEIGSKRYRSWTMNKLKNFINDWTAVTSCSEPLLVTTH